MELKLSNFLDNIELFLNECYLYSESTDTGILNTELHHIDYSINENKIQLLNYVLDNFHEFEMIFSYSEKEFNEISKLLSDKNTYKSMYLEILGNLLDRYRLSELDLEIEDDGLVNYTECEIQRMNNDKYCVGCEKTTKELYHDNYSTGLCCECNDTYDNKSGFCSLSCSLGNGCDGSC